MATMVIQMSHNITLYVHCLFYEHMMYNYIHKNHWYEDKTVVDTFTVKYNV
jgi:hypothetical protein